MCVLDANTLRSHSRPAVGPSGIQGEKLINLTPISFPRLFDPRSSGEAERHDTHCAPTTTHIGTTAHFMRHERIVPLRGMSGRADFDAKDWK
jgi:hypothetical protein